MGRIMAASSPSQGDDVQGNTKDEKRQTVFCTVNESKIRSVRFDLLFRQRGVWNENWMDVFAFRPLSHKFYLCCFSVEGNAVNQLLLIVLRHHLVITLLKDLPDGFIAIGIKVFFCL